IASLISSETAEAVLRCHPNLGWLRLRQRFSRGAQLARAARVPNQQRHGDDGTATKARAMCKKS
ncbi:MAG: hypothetical protein ACUVVU_03545, partial [Tepidimonas sp.]|uniref:hypothetical protein n=1 Tax=Tepidimonas sp. TaxID=2002775 RepID=UPI004054B3F1